MKKRSLLFVILFLLCGSLNLPALAAEAPAAQETVLFSADFDTSATLEEIGISATDWGGAELPSDFSMTVADGKLNVKRGSAVSGTATLAFEFLSKEKLVQAGKLKVEYDISSAIGGKNSKGTDYSVGLEACKSATEANSYYSFQMCGKTFGMVFSSAKVNNSWQRAKADYRYAITELNGVFDGLNRIHHVELVFDFDNHTVDYSIDGVAASDKAPLPKDDSGMALEFYGKPYDVSIDNLKATQLCARGEGVIPGGEDTTEANTTDEAQKPGDTASPTTNPKPTDTKSPTSTKKPTDTTGTSGNSSETDKPAKENEGCRSVGGWSAVAFVILGGCSAFAVCKKKQDS